MKKLLIIIIVLLAAVLMTQTLPDKKAHKAAMMEAVKDYVDEEAKNRLGDNILADLSKVFANNSIKAVLGVKLKLHNYYLFNTTSMHIDGKDQLMSVGLLGHVFTFDKEMLRERLEEAEKPDNDDTLDDDLYN
ncbi:MAG: DUF4359 domain-containing protein [Prevotella sp.]|nr:DUF4359 domain-containing protein [Prevotella sp.]